VCRRLGINRQQFNKYVAGMSRPSNRNMRRVCDFFGVEEFEILAPFAELKKIIAVKGVRAPDQHENVAEGRLGAIVRAGQQGLAKYFGYYYCYYYSFSRPGKVLKSLVHVFDADGIACYKRIERLVERNTERDASFVYKYEGVMLGLRDRLYMTDRESLTGGEISQTVLYPSYKNKVDILTGLTLGTAGRTSREPICSRVALEYLGPSIPSRQTLARCQLYLPDAAEVGAAIEALIRNRIPKGQYSLRAVAQ
jgi:transcriptional regulator with XRE-family HTH domain